MTIDIAKIALIALARILGAQNGWAAGSAVFDGNSTDADMIHAIELSDNGDPRIDEIFARCRPSARRAHRVGPIGRG
ncbi:MAG: hypothetical protein ACRDQ0_13570 [Pseudonocardia sp.]